MSQKNAKRKRKEHQILGGHRQDKKNTFTCMPPNTSGISYVDHGAPELAWLAVVIEELGPRIAAKIVEIIAVAIRREPPAKAPPPLFATFMATLSSSQQLRILHELESAGLLGDLRAALAPFVSLYPMFPPKWLSGAAQIEPKTEYLDEFKSLLGELLDKASARTSLVLAHLIYGALVSRTLIVPPGIFDNLDGIRDYPNTEESEMLAATLRSTVTMLVGQGLQESTTAEWAGYFWQRGLELEPVNYSALR